MKAIDIRDVAYRYPGRDAFAVRGLTLEVEEGEFVLVRGASGCGKSTLCRMLNGLIPHYFGGELAGEVRIFGKPSIGRTVAESARDVGLVFQDPENQLAMSEVESEIAFGPENMMMTPQEIGWAIADAAAKLGISGLLTRKTSELSCGEKQKVALASVLAMRPRLLVLDEPASQLDPASRAALWKTLSMLHSESITILVVEHRADEIAPYVTRTIDLTPGATEAEARAPRYPTPAAGDVVLDVANLSFGYPGLRVLDNVSLRVRAGECLSITGPNGAGKTTLVKHFNGLLKADAGSVSVCGMDASKTPTEMLARSVAYLPQNPTDMLFCERARDELQLTLDNLGLRGDVDGWLGRFGLSALADAYPRDLSVGQRQRLALAAVMVADPKLLVLDEPTRGADQQAIADLKTAIRQMRAEGRAVVLVTQEMGLISELNARQMHLEARR